MKRILLLFASFAVFPLVAAELPESIRFEPGPVNAISITSGEEHLAINRSIEAAPDLLLLTHARRDIAEYARDSSPKTVRAHLASQEFLEGTEKRWTEWWNKRFDYYEQQVTRIPVTDFPADKYLEDGAEFTWKAISFRVLATPGYTRDGATYLAEIDGTKVAFTGDLILDGGKVPDLYSFQEAIPEAKIGGYHGYLGRLAIWLKSLDKIADAEPDLIIPSRGEIIENPIETIRSARNNARKIYRSYLITNALHWYFGEERMNTCAEQVLGPGETVEGMPLAEHIDLPEWCQHIGTTKLLVSKSGRGFVLDVGGKKSFETLQLALREGLITGIDGIFATHTHNDHTAAIAEASETFQCAVYAVAEVADVIENPGNWFLPGVSSNAVENVETRANGETMQWEEFDLSFYFFPGQMFNHGALLVEKADHDPVLFMGDSFSPSGIDDYCLMNRNLMGEDTGYELCFRKIDSLPENLWMVNQHIPHLFRFTRDEKEYLLRNYRERRDLISEFVDWDHPDYAVDPQWASFYPYGQIAEAGDPVSTTIKLHNHSASPRSFTVELRSTDLDLPESKTIELPGRQSGEIEFSFQISDSTPKGVNVITGNVKRDDGVRSRSICETLLMVE